MAPVAEQSPQEIQPLKTLKELLEWKVPAHEIGQLSTRSLQPRYPACEPKQLKTLVCHDMKGGYLDDRFYNGSSNENSYRFYHWSGIDMFVYFSHNLVTIPPLCWVNAAHLHGVKVLGTFITEWAPGEELCRSLLTSKESVQHAVARLVEIAGYHHFEGWLINIENAIDAEQVDMLVYFVKELTASMRELTPDSVVLWYDSVTKEGNLDWQNELSSMNRCYFDACDGIFLNYTWTDDHLKRSHEAAGERFSDVYVGLDVFGRNFYEGGKFNTYKAMELVRANHLSAAIFAQGWTYETQENFEEAEDKLWRSLSPYLHHHGPQFLPFRTSFCQGIGKKIFCFGKCHKPSTWYNLSEQQYQPIWPHEKGVSMKMVTTDAFDGGGSLELSTSSPTTVRLFVCDIQWKKALLVSITFKWCASEIPASLICCLKENSSDGESDNQRNVSMPLKEKREVQVMSTTSEISSEEVKHNVELVSSSESEGWITRKFRMPEGKDTVLQEIAIRMEGVSAIRIGYIDVNSVSR